MAAGLEHHGACQQKQNGDRQADFPGKAAAPKPVVKQQHGGGKGNYAGRHQVIAHFNKGKQVGQQNHRA